MKQMHFNDPTSSDLLPLDELIGALLLFVVYEETDPINTVHGPQTAVRADVVVLDGEKEGEQFDDSLIFPRVLKAQLRRSAGGMMVVGRLGQGNKKPGQNPPWTLAAATDADKAVATKWVNSNGHPAEVKAEAEAAASKPF
jgi:hypothetical protein